MKKACTLLLFLLAQIVSSQVWEPLGSPSEEPATVAVVAIDGNDVPYQVLINAQNGTISVRKFIGPDWEYVGSPEFANVGFVVPSIAIDPSGTPYVAFPDSSSENKASVMRFNGIDWEYVGEPGISNGGIFQIVALAIDDQGMPFIGYSESIPETSANVKRYNGTAWEQVGAMGISDVFIVSRLNFDSNGMLHAVTIKSSPDQVTEVFKFDGSQWATVGGPIFPGSQTVSLSLEFDSTDRPHVALSGPDVGVVAVFNDTEWQLAGDALLSVGPTLFAEIRFVNGVLYAGYMNADGYTITKLAGTSWEMIGERLPLNNVPALMDVDSTGNVYVSHPDENSNAVVQKFCPRCLPSTELQQRYCGSVVPNFGSDLYVKQIPAANSYRFRVSDGGNTEEVVRESNLFRINMLSSYDYNTTYTIDVAVNINGEWGYYGTACTVTTPAPAVSTLAAAYCGTTVETFGSDLYATPVTFADGYRFSISDGTSIEEITRSNRLLRLNMLSTYSYDTTYYIQVAARVDGVWGEYGPVCSVNTPAPFTRLSDDHCDSSNVGFDDLLTANRVDLADAYRFIVSDGTNTVEIEKARPQFRLRLLGFQNTSTVYAVQVAARVNGVWGAYGDLCTVSTSASGMRQNMMNGFDSEEEDLTDQTELTAYPNPFNSTFRLSLQTASDEPVRLQSFDITGKMLEDITASPTEMQEITIGERYSSGIYIINTTQGSFSKSFRMVKN